MSRNEVMINKGIIPTPIAFKESCMKAHLRAIITKQHLFYSSPIPKFRHDVDHTGKGKNLQFLF